MNAWALKDMANTYSLCIHLQVNPFYKCPPPPVTTDIMLCSLRLPYKWINDCSRNVSWSRLILFYFVHTSELSHCVRGVSLVMCVCVCVCVIWCSKCMEENLIRSDSASVINERSFIAWHSAWQENSTAGTLSTKKDGAEWLQLSKQHSLMLKHSLHLIIKCFPS